MTLADRLRSWAQNEEMVDSSYTEHGKDCNAAADRIEKAEAERDALKADADKAQRVIAALMESDHANNMRAENAERKLARVREIVSERRFEDHEWDEIRAILDEVPT